MYSVVLMMALSGGAETPDWGHRCGHCGHGGSHGCHQRVHHGCHHRVHHGCHHRSHGHCGHGGHAHHGGCCGHNGGGVYYDGGAPMPAPAPAPAPRKAEIPTPATIVVMLPADARLTIDGNATTSITNRRIFTSPALQPGQDFVYTLRAEIIREGQTVAETQNVTVRAGEETPVQFTFSSQGVASR